MIDQDESRIMETIMRDQEQRFVMNNIAKPATGETQGGKPRICEVLGVEVGERFKVRGSICAYVDENGIVRWDDNDIMNPVHICDLINDKSRIIRKPRFTEEEVAAAKMLLSAGAVSV